MQFDPIKQLSYWSKSGNIPHGILWIAHEITQITPIQTRFVTHLLCERFPEKSCGQCCACVAQYPPDLLQIDGASAIKIDQIRSLIDFFKLTPHSSSHRVAIIHEAHKLNTQAANGLLKLLEEPPSHCYLFLNTAFPDRLPATLKSRLSRIVFPTVWKSYIKTQCQTHTPLIKVWTDLIEGKQSLIDVAHRLNEQNFSELLKALLWLWADSLKFMMTQDQNLWLENSSQELAALTASLSPEKVLSCWKHTLEAHRLYQTAPQLNGQLLIENCLIESLRALS